MRVWTPWGKKAMVGIRYPMLNITQLNTLELNPLKSTKSTRDETNLVLCQIGKFEE